MAKPRLLRSAPPVLVSLYKRLKLAPQVAKKVLGQPPHGNFGPAWSLPLLERLLTNPEMNTVWQRLGHGLSGKSASEQDTAYRGLWGAIQYARVRYKVPVVPRRKMLQAIRRIAQGLRIVGDVIATRREAVPPWLLYECLPDDLAEMIENEIWTPRLTQVAREVNEKARTVLARKRQVDRNNQGWGAFLRLLKSQCPTSLSRLCSHETLAQIARTVLPDEELPKSTLTAIMVRNALRPSEKEREQLAQVLQAPAPSRRSN